MFLIGEQIRVCSAILAGLGARREVLLEVVAHLLQDAEDLRRAHGGRRVHVRRRRVGLRSAILSFLRNQSNLRELSAPLTEIRHHLMSVIQASP